jgi:hypothetical protein
MKRAFLEVMTVLGQFDVVEEPGSDLRELESVWVFSAGDWGC